MAGPRRRLPGLVIGSLIATSFGLVFVLVNSGGLAEPWPLIIRVAGVVVAGALLVATFGVARSTPAPVAPAGGGFAGLGYWAIVGAEVLALFGGLIVLDRLFHRSDIGVAWVAVVVGVHFFGLARLWHLPMFSVLAAVLTVLGLAGFVLAAAGASAAVVGLVAGVGSGAALFGSVLAGLRQGLRAARSRPGVQDTGSPAI